MGKIIAVVSGKGGVGKTTLTAQLGYVLAQRGARTVLADGDLGLRDLDLVLGVENEVLFDVVDVWKERCFLEDALVSLQENLDFLPASQTYRWEDLGRKGYRRLLKSLRKSYDFVIVDCPAGLGRGWDTIMEVADGAVVVATPDWVALRDVSRLLQLCHERRFFTYEFVLNGLPLVGEATQVVADTLRVVPVEEITALLPWWPQTPPVEGLRRFLEPLAEALQAEVRPTEAALLASYQALLAELKPVKVKAKPDKESAVFLSEASGEQTLLRRQLQSRWRYRRR